MKTQAAHSILGDIMQERRDDILREMEKLQDELDAAFREISGARQPAPWRNSKAAM